MPLTPPIAPKAVPHWEQTYASAVYDRHGFVVPISARRTESLAFAPEAIDPAQFVPIRVIRRPAVYGGLIYPQFGHNLLELPGRLWACPDPGDRRPVVFHQVQSPANRMDESWSYLGPLLLAAGLGRRRIVVVRGPMLCEDLLVPQPTIAISQSIRAGFHDVYRRIVRRMPLPPVEAHRRIYLSRSRFTPTRPTPVNERALEARLAEALGFKVIYPEELSVERQIAHIRNAEIVAGLDGSALHMALFARPGTMVISLATRLLVNQAVIDFAAELRGRHIDIGGVPDEPSDWRLDVEALVGQIAALIAAG
ncbi:glycosyltransferase family 61 protein [Prosthecodimorpha staleyi]|uniref:Glycosyltransferase family 61 protein n=1 Tax=Prosthecodimorpha staleyi TaxID=2840188 RepID=A0A947D8E9_9HYPH|nr:glycosyltransferase family 61 protein [Prosthecodimorpha staleyi]MBT9290112.1 glycosyltransferase family 61 protein [Prosthecodimorpha staleyi]